MLIDLDPQGHASLGLGFKPETMTRTIYNAIAGNDKRDSTSATESVPDYTQALGGDIRGLRLGIPSEYFVAGMQPEVEQPHRAKARQ